MKIAVWYNTTEHGMAGLGAYLGNREPEEECFCFIHEYETSAAPYQSFSLEQIAEVVWRQFNVVDGTELPVELETRSMSVGDVVIIDGVALRAMSFGFERIDWPEEDTEGE